MSRSAHYSKIEVLNDGACGVVWLCEDPSTHAHYALKQCHDDEEAAREINALQLLSHPRVIRLIDSFQSFPYTTLVLEFWGTDLQSLIHSSRLALPHIRRYTRELLEGLSYLHSIGWVHRDVKPSNILISEDNGVKLIDFGVCRRVDDKSGVALSCTWQYAPLDYLLGSGDCSPAFDIWGAGCVLAEMLLGRILFDGQGQLAIALSILKTLGTPTDETWPESRELEYCQNYVMPQFEATLPKVCAGIDAHARDLIEKMLCVSKGRRITAADALCHPFLTGE
jgi:serine/threonine protein kinase